MKYYRYKYLRTSASVPENSRQFWEDDDNDYIFMVDDTSHDLIYSADEGANWSTAHTGTVGTPCFDRANSKIYFVGEGHIVYFVDTSNPAGGATAIVDLTDDIAEADEVDMFVIDGTPFLIVVDTNNYTADDIVVYDVSADPIVYKDHVETTGTDNTWTLAEGCVAGDAYYFLIDERANNLCYIYKYDKSDGAVTIEEACDAATSRPTITTHGMSYDNSDKLTFILEYDGDSKSYYMTYSIADDAISKGGNITITVLSNEHNDTSLAIPFGTAKAFHTSSYFVYTLSKNKTPGTTYMIADLNYCDEVPASAIFALSDTFLITANGKLYKLTAVSDELTDATCTHKFQSYSSGFIGSNRQLGSDQIVQFYDDNDLLWFQGKILKPMNFMGHYSSALEGLGKSDLNTKISVDYSTTLTDIHTIAKACIDALPDYSHLWYDASSMPDPSVTIMVKFMNRELKDCLNVLAKAINGIWWVEPSGYTWLLKLSSLSASGLAYTQASQDWRPPLFWTNLQLVNRVQVFGHFGLKSEAAIDQAHQQKYGVKNWYGEDDYPSIHDQECLNDFAIALLALGGAANNALRIKTLLIAQNRIELGETISIQDTHATELADATAYPMLRLRFDCLQNRVEVIASNNVTTSLGRSG